MRNDCSSLAELANQDTYRMAVLARVYNEVNTLLFGLEPEQQEQFLSILADKYGFKVSRRKGRSRPQFHKPNTLPE